MLARDELDREFPGQAWRQTPVPTITVAELLRAYARLPLDDDDRRAVVTGFALRLREGRRLSAMPLEPGLDELGRESKRAVIQQLAPQGLAFVTALDLEVSLLIVKTDAGRGFLGRQKATYTCFVSEGADHFEHAGVMPSIPKAFGILDSFHQIRVAIDRAMG